MIHYLRSLNNKIKKSNRHRFSTRPRKDDSVSQEKKNFPLSNNGSAPPQPIVNGKVTTEVPKQDEKIKFKKLSNTDFENIIPAYRLRDLSLGTIDRPTRGLGSDLVDPMKNADLMQKAIIKYQHGQQRQQEEKTATIKEKAITDLEILKFYKKQMAQRPPSVAIKLKRIEKLGGLVALEKAEKHGAPKGVSTLEKLEVLNHLGELKAMGMLDGLKAVSELEQLLTMEKRGGLKKLGVLEKLELLNLKELNALQTKLQGFQNKKPLPSKSPKKTLNRTP